MATTRSKLLLKMALNAGPIVQDESDNNYTDHSSNNENVDNNKDAGSDEGVSISNKDTAPDEGVAISNKDVVLNEGVSIGDEVNNNKIWNWMEQWSVENKPIHSEQKSKQNSQNVSKYKEADDKSSVYNYVSPSEMDDSDKDRDYIPDNDDLSSVDIPIVPKLTFKDDDSFCHRSLSPSSRSSLETKEKSTKLLRKKKFKLAQDVCNFSLEEESRNKLRPPTDFTDANEKCKQTENLILKSEQESKKVRILSNVIVRSKNEEKYLQEKILQDGNPPDFKSPEKEGNNLQEKENLRNTNSSHFKGPKLSEVLKRKKHTTKKTIRCRFCDDEIDNKNFMRHLQRKHCNENEVVDIFKYEKGSRERRNAFAMLRNNTNFDLYVSGIVRPNKHQTEPNNDRDTYYPCSYCRGIFTKRYLKRHTKRCSQKNEHENKSRINSLTLSQTAVACAMDPTDVISKLNIKKQVFDLMKPDDIAFEAKKDLLIANFGESYMKKHKRERMVYACSNRMRELSRLLISFRQITNNQNSTFTDLLHPKNFDNVLFATRKIVGYDHVKKTFVAPSLAMHLGTSLKLACEELTHLILKQSRGFRCSTAEHARLWLQNVKNFKKLVESRWNIEMASLANKELQEKKWKKPLLLPLVSDIKKFRDSVTSLAQEAISQLTNSENKQAYKLLSKCTLSLLILFNRRRIGDVQYLKICDYKLENKSNYCDFNDVLTEGEKMLTHKYKRVLNSGKGSRAVAILIPTDLEIMIDMLLEEREKYITDKENQYVFAIPDSTIKWGKGDVAIRELAKKVKLENPEAISSNKLRKQIATITQILNLKPNEAKQFANFMGHTQKTHDEFYELPVDIFQTAKISKLLLMMEKGTVPVEYKGKSLDEINFDPNLEYAEEDIIIGNPNTTETDSPGFYVNETIAVVNEKSTDFPIIDGMDSEQNLPGTSETTNPIADEEIDIGLNAVVQKGQRKQWSNRELHLLKTTFSAYIRKGCYPPGNELKEFISKTGNPRSVASLKAKIQHLIKKKT